MIRHLKNTILATAFLAVSGAHAAPILEVSSDGKLTGASGVEVGGALYDVAFKDGTCAGLFSGCDQAADFQFKSKTDLISNDAQPSCPTLASRSMLYIRTAYLR